MELHEENFFLQKIQNLKAKTQIISALSTKKEDCRNVLFEPYYPKPISCFLYLLQSLSPDHSFNEKFVSRHFFFLSFLMSQLFPQCFLSCTWLHTHLRVLLNYLTTVVCKTWGFTRYNFFYVEHHVNN